MTYEEFLKRYEFDTQDQKALLGAGGFGSVYKAFDTVQKRFVAIKVAEVKHEKFNLLYEKQIVDELDSHENVARYGNCYRFQFMPVRYDFAVLNFFQEGNLADVLKKYALTIAQKQQILEGILKGVGHLHKHHIIHRDMKPQNVLMDKQGDNWIPKVTDFGLSKLADTNTRSVENSSIGLSIAYAAPEQIQNREIRHNVDLWAVGIIAYQMFVGDLPFDAARSMSQESWNLEVSKLIVKGKVSDKISQIPEPFRTIIKKCLLPDNTKRVQKAEELLAILGPSVSQNTQKRPADEENTIRMDEPFSNLKELTGRADGYYKLAESKSGFEKEQALRDAVKVYQEILRVDPSNRHANERIESCKQLLSQKAAIQLPSKKMVLLAASAIFGIGLLYFFYWKYNAKKELTWAKSAFFSKILPADSLQTYQQIYQVLDKYAGTLAMDDTTNNLLGTFYQWGRGGAIGSYEKAMDYYERADDYEWAKYNIACLHFNGKGTRKNFETALEYFEDAYDQKQLVGAAECLGYIYEEGGYGVTRDYALAKNWYEKAVAANSSYAQFELGRMYQMGLGMPVNESRAKYYYGQAAAQGNWNAQQSLNSMNSRRNSAYTASVSPFQSTAKPKSTRPKSNAGAFWEKVGSELFKQAARK
ncbi:serine/threonine-protein kinase [Dyadobacter pollutisoli]|uniref:Serine/threonine-protein kinase n=1 Tax=Dyadobacter pollutisoli TaxID=2910158 RepID=A0A9E8SIT5_9BACT|nr:serine/threonine-protein kinase [Dyadobacter pollutisoli]WAC10143.1 serine/threonine-protein kinase [Dyadobacter pollutisoli]